MPQIEQKHRGLTTKWKIIILLVLFAISVGVGVQLFLYQRDQDRKAVAAAVAKAKPLILRAKYDEALKVLEDAYPKAHTKAEQLDLIYRAGGANVTKGDYAAALKAFKQSEAKGGLTFEIARQIGYANGKLGHKDEAISYYKKAIELAPAAKLAAQQDEIAEINERIKALERGER